MAESLTLYYVDWFSPSTEDQNISSNMVVLSENTYHNLIQSININYLLFLFTITCFSTIAICTRLDKNQYKLIPKTDTINVQNDNMEKGKIDI